MVNVKVEVPRGVVIEIEVIGDTKLIDILNLLEMDYKKVYVFVGRYDGEIGTPLLNFNYNMVDYNMWFPLDKSYYPSIIILDDMMNSKDRARYEYYKSVGY